MQASEVHRLLAAHLRIPGAARTKSNPLVLALKSSVPHLFLWMQVSRDGWIEGFGNKFVPTFSCRAASKFTIGAGEDVRLGRLLDDDQRRRATAVHNAIVRPPLVGAAIDRLPRDLADHLRAQLRPREIPFTEHDDLWLRYRSSADVAHWADFLSSEWETVLPRCEAWFSRRG